MLRTADHKRYRLARIFKREIIVWMVRKRACSLQENREGLRSDLDRGLYRLIILQYACCAPFSGDDLRDREISVLKLQPSHDWQKQLAPLFLCCPPRCSVCRPPPPPRRCLVGHCALPLSHSDAPQCAALSSPPR